MDQDEWSDMNCFTWKPYNHFSVDGPASLSYKLEYKNIYNMGYGVLWDFIFLLSHSCWFFSHQFI